MLNELESGLLSRRPASRQAGFADVADLAST